MAGRRCSLLLLGLIMLLPAPAEGASIVSGQILVQTRTIDVDPAAGVIYGTEVVGVLPPGATDPTSETSLKRWDLAGMPLPDVDLTPLLGDHSSMHSVAFDEVTGRMVGIAHERVSDSPSQFEGRLVEFSADGSQLFLEEVISPVPPGWSDPYFSQIRGFHVAADGWWVLRNAVPGDSSGGLELFLHDRDGSVLSSNIVSVATSVDFVFGMGGSPDGNLMLLARQEAFEQTWLVEIDRQGNELESSVLREAGGLLAGGDVSYDPTSGLLYVADFGNRTTWLVSAFVPEPPAPGLAALAITALAAALRRRRSGPR